MVRKYFALLSLLVFFLSMAPAQVLERGEITLSSGYRDVPDTRSGQSLWFTYVQGQKVEAIGASSNYYDCAIKIPGYLAGNKIDAIAFLPIDIKSIGRVKCWVADKLPSKVDDANCIYLKDVTPTHSKDGDGELEVVETNGVIIPEGGCYVGYSFSVINMSLQTGKYPVAMDGAEGRSGGAYLNYGRGFADICSQGFGNLVVKARISGDSFMNNAALFSETSSKTSVAALNETVKIGMPVTNIGQADITSLDYTVKDISTGEVSAEKTAIVESVGFNQIAEVMFDVDAGSDINVSSEKEIVITKVNGLPNECAEGHAARCTLKVVSRKVQRKVVEEEFTATGCVYCTRGYAGMAALADKYPDTFIGIAVHGSINYIDPMQISDYNSVISMVTGFPSAMLNRQQVVDPYYGSGQQALGIVEDFESLQGLAEAELMVKPQWNSDYTAIDVTTDVKFLFDSEDAPYAIGYVLLEDGLKYDKAFDGNKEQNWNQANAYAGASGMEDEPYLYEWTQKPQSVSDMEYNHVAVMAKDVSGGKKGSVVAPIVCEQVQTNTTSFDLSNGIRSYNGFELLRDKSKFKVVALLFNTETGSIINAAEAAVPYTAGIGGIADDGVEAVEVARYSVDGIRKSASGKGISIIRMSDGTVRKVIEK